MPQKKAATRENANAAKAKAPADPVAAAFAHFKKADPLLYAAALPFKAELSLAVAPVRVSGKKLFASLASSITSQQLSTKAAETIWGRLQAACKGEVTPEAVLKLRVPAMRKAGLSAAKVKALKALAAAVTTGELDLLKLRTLPEEEAVEKLSAVWGIGRWTAEMFLMFALKRADVFSPGDLGLRRSIEAIYGLPKDVHIRELSLIAEKWSPHRTIASRILWRARDSG